MKVIYLAPLGVETGVDVMIVADEALLVGVARSWLPPGVLNPGGRPWPDGLGVLDRISSRFLLGLADKLRTDGTTLLSVELEKNVLFTLRYWI